MPETGPLNGCTQCIDLQAQAIQSQCLPQSQTHHLKLGVNIRAVCPEYLHTKLMKLMRKQSPSSRLVPHVYFVLAGEGTIEAGMQLAEQLRQNVSGIRVQINLGGGSFKSQFKRADRW